MLHLKFLNIHECSGSDFRKSKIYAGTESIFHGENKLNSDVAAALFKLEVITNILVTLSLNHFLKIILIYSKTSQEVTH